MSHLFGIPFSFVDGQSFLALFPMDGLSFFSYSRVYVMCPRLVLPVVYHFVLMTWLMLILLKPMLLLDLLLQGA